MVSIRWRRSRIAVCVCLTLLLSPTAPIQAFAFGGESHKHAAWEGTALFMPFMRDDVSPDEKLIERDPKYPLLPALEFGESSFYREGWEEGVDEEDGTEALPEVMSNRYWVWYGAKREDDLDTEYGIGDAYTRTIAHFWELDDGVCHMTGSGNANAWTKAEETWAHSIDFWRRGEDGWAYFYLGKVVHLLTDQGQPAHPHGDLHPGGVLDDDSLEEWSSKDEAELFSWYTPGKTSFGEVIWPISPQQVRADIAAHPDVWGDEMQQWVHTDCPIMEVPFYDELAAATSPHSVEPLFYLMSYVNQSADFLPSDSFEGDTLDYLNWVDFGQFDQSLRTLDLGDNDDTCDTDDGQDHSTCKNDQCNADGDLMRVYTAGYTTAVRAIPGLIDHWRRTLDSRAPSSTVEITRTDGAAVAEWNNSPVTVHMTSAEDTETSGGRASGLWKIHGEMDGELSEALDDTPSWGLSEEGVHTLECMSVDLFGNVERHSLDVGIDLTAPTVTFPTLQPNYLTSQDLAVSWEATDALSGVAGSYALLDGTAVVDDQVIDLADKAGRHTLEVYCTDVAGNIRYAAYDFEVWIDAVATAQPIRFNDKSNGGAMFIDLQLPAPYAVADIDLATARLSVKGSLDLGRPFPIVEPSARLSAMQLGGVANGPAGGLPWRSIRFDRAAFLMALEMDTGDISSAAWGSLGTTGSPRYVARVVTTVFSPPPK